MADKILVLNIDMFAADQTALHADGRVEKIPTAELDKYLSAVCYSRAGGYNKVHMIGSERYIEGLLNQINYNYSNSNVEIEVN